MQKKESANIHHLELDIQDRQLNPAWVTIIETAKVILLFSMRRSFFYVFITLKCTLLNI